MLRLVGITASDQHEATFNSEELRAILASSAHAGAISARQRQFAENILGFVNLQARHILVPRLEVVWLSVERPLSENLAIIRESGHTRFPLCTEDLDSVVGIVHTKNIMAVLTTNEPVDLVKIARSADALSTCWSCLETSPFPEAAELLGLDDGGEDDTIGGHVVSLLKRLPEEGDELLIGLHRVTVIEVSQRRVERLRVEPVPQIEAEDGG